MALLTNIRNLQIMIRKTFIPFMLFFVDLLGCSSNLERKNIQSIEISREECIAKVRNSTSPFRPGKQCSLELSELIQLFLPVESGISLGWDIGADVKTPIEWKTIGRSPGCDGTPGENTPERCGEIFVTENGVIDHTILEKTIQPGVWTVSLYGSNVGVNTVALNAEADITLDHLLNNLNKSEFTLSMITKNDPWYGSSLREVLYNLKVSGKPEAWLKEEMSCGASGEHCSFTLTIFHDKKVAIQTLHYQNH